MCASVFCRVIWRGLFFARACSIGCLVALAWEGRGAHNHPSAHLMVSSVLAADVFYVDVFVCNVLPFRCLNC